MGRAAKQKAARRSAQPSTGVQLDELDFRRLAAARDKVNNALFAGQQSVQQAAADADKVVTAAREQFVKALGVAQAKYALDPQTDYNFDDDRFLLIPKAKE